MSLFVALEAGGPNVLDSVVIGERMSPWGSDVCVVFSDFPFVITNVNCLNDLSQ
jgi:hypothetical protein